MANIFVFDPAYLTMKRNQIKTEITSARYKIGDTWYTGTIQSKTVTSDGTIEITALISQTGGIVTKIELYAGATLVGSKTVSIDRTVSTENVFYLQRMRLIQSEE